jgi:hypothetical protein
MRCAVVGEVLRWAALGARPGGPGRLVIDVDATIYEVEGEQRPTHRLEPAAIPPDRVCIERRPRLRLSRRAGGRAARAPRRRGRTRRPPCGGSRGPCAAQCSPCGASSVPPAQTWLTRSDPPPGLWRLYANEWGARVRSGAVEVALAR